MELTAVLVTLLAAGMSWGQVEVQPEVVNILPAGLGPGIGGRAAAMGDAGVALATDATALYWNPAGLALAPGQGWHPASVRYHSDGLGVSDLLGMVDTIGGGEVSMDDYRLLESLEGRAPCVGGSAMVGYRGGNWAVGAYAQAISGFSVEDRGGGELRLVGYGLDVASYGGAYADRLAQELYWGVQVGWLKGGAGRTWGSATATGAGDVVSTIQHRSNHATDWNANLGLMYQATDRVRLGLVVRNLNSPTLTFWGTDVTDFDPSVHLGVAAWSDDYRTVAAGDVHNLFRANGESPALCLGVEHLVSDAVALRAGLNDGDFTFGAGLRLGSLRLDLASGVPLDEEISITATIGH